MTGHLIDTFSLEEWFAVAHSCLRGFSQWSNVSDSGTGGWASWQTGAKEEKSLLTAARKQRAQACSGFFLFCSTWSPSQSGSSLSVSPPSGWVLSRGILTATDLVHISNLLGVYPSNHAMSVRVKCKCGIQDKNCEQLGLKVEFVWSWQGSDQGWTWCQRRWEATEEPLVEIGAPGIGTRGKEKGRGRAISKESAETCQSELVLQRTSGTLSLFQCWLFSVWILALVWFFSHQFLQLLMALTDERTRF